MYCTCGRTYRKLICPGCCKIEYVTNGAIEAIYKVKDGTWQNEEGEGEAGASN